MKWQRNRTAEDDQNPCRQKIRQKSKTPCFPNALPVKLLFLRHLEQEKQKQQQARQQQKAVQEKKRLLLCSTIWDSP